MERKDIIKNFCLSFLLKLLFATYCLVVKVPDFLPGLKSDICPIVTSNY